MNKSFTSDSMVFLNFATLIYKDVTKHIAEHEDEYNEHSLNRYLKENSCNSERNLSKKAG